MLLKGAKGRTRRGSSGHVNRCGEFIANLRCGTEPRPVFWTTGQMFSALWMCAANGEKALGTNSWVYKRGDVQVKRDNMVT